MRVEAIINASGIICDGGGNCLDTAGKENCMVWKFDNRNGNDWKYFRYNMPYNCFPAWKKIKYEYYYNDNFIISFF